MAADLGFARRFENSIDAVSDRDFVAEALFDLALLGVHLSRIGEEVVLWSTEEFGFLHLADAYATGSSMLPQKKNPDVAELARGKAGRLIGHLTGRPHHPEGPAARVQPRPAGGQGAAVRRRRPGGPGAWAPRLVCSPTPLSKPRGGGRPTRPEAAAVDLADHLVGKGTPFRDAHALVGALVRDALERHVPLTELVEAHPPTSAPRPSPCSNPASPSPAAPHPAPPALRPSPTSCAASASTCWSTRNASATTDD